MEGENSKNIFQVKFPYSIGKIYDLNITKPDIVLSTSMIYTKPKQDWYWDQNTCMNKISNEPKKSVVEKFGGRKCLGAEMSRGRNV